MEEHIKQETLTRRTEQVRKLRSIKSPEQKSKEWFKLRYGRITASDAGCILGNNHYARPYEFMLKKAGHSTFTANKFCHHGNKYEEIANMIYSYRMNVLVYEFGMMGHYRYKYLGASPDGICSEYQLDGKTLSKLVGRMLEIKCPLSRKIMKSGEPNGVICPSYYWDQVQLQLDACELDDCDFFQCKIDEYFMEDEFVEDTDEKKSFLSKETGYEKGCVIQLMPKNPELDNVFEHSKYIYPPRIEMSPDDCKTWIAEQTEIINKGHPDFPTYKFDRVIYWKLVNYHNLNIKKDPEWITNSLPLFKKMWKYVLFFRRNQDKFQILNDYIDSIDYKNNDNIMNVAHTLYSVREPDYDGKVKAIEAEIEQNKQAQLEIDEIEKNMHEQCMF